MNGRLALLSLFVTSVGLLYFYHFYSDFGFNTYCTPVDSESVIANPILGTKVAIEMSCDQYFSDINQRLAKSWLHTSFFAVAICAFFFIIDAALNYTIRLRVRSSSSFSAAMVARLCNIDGAPSGADKSISSLMNEIGAPGESGNFVDAIMCVYLGGFPLLYGIVGQLGLTYFTHAQ